MISLAGLARLAAAFPDDLELLDHPVAPLTLAGRVLDLDARPAVMGVVNLSRDSTYRSSIAPSVEAAIRHGRVMAAQGADIVDVGAESTDNRTRRVPVEEQIGLLVPVVEALAADGIVVSTESYEPPLTRAALEAGSRVVNLTGSADDDTMFTLAAEYDAAVVLCHVTGTHARSLDGAPLDPDPVPAMLDAFGARLERARALGAEQVVIDPGVGFGVVGGDSPAERTARQTKILLHTFRLRSLGVPVCHSVPHAFDLFEDQFRTGEGFFTVLARLSGTGLLRTHEVPHVVAVLRAMTELSVELPGQAR